MVFSWFAPALGNLIGFIRLILNGFPNYFGVLLLGVIAGGPMAALAVHHVLIEVARHKS